MPYSVTASTADCYPNTTVLVNKLGLRSQEALNEAERVAVSVRSVEAENERCTARFTFAFYCKLHERLFSDIYEWAGKLRAVDLSKKGTNFYPAEQLNELGTALFQRLQQKHELVGLSKSDFVSELAEFYHDLNMLHPFREGNGRTQRLFFTLLIRRAGYQINFSECDTDELMMATIFAAQGVKDPLFEFFTRYLR